MHDQKAFRAFAIIKNAKTFRKVFASIEAAKQYVRNFNKVLDTEYSVFYSSDKQFGMAKESEGFAIPYTKKQLSDVDSIYKKMSIDAIFNEAYDQLDLSYIKRLIREDSYKDCMSFLKEKVEDVVGPAQVPYRVRKAVESLYFKLF